MLLNILESEGQPSRHQTGSECQQWRETLLYGPGTFPFPFPLLRSHWPVNGFCHCPRQLTTRHYALPLDQISTWGQSDSSGFQHRAGGGKSGH